MSEQNMRAATVSMTMDPTRANPIRTAIDRTRAVQSNLSPAQRAMREAARRDVDSLMSTGLYSLRPTA